MRHRTAPREAICPKSLISRQKQVNKQHDMDSMDKWFSRETLCWTKQWLTHRTEVNPWSGWTRQMKNKAQVCKSESSRSQSVGGATQTRCTARCIAGCSETQSQKQAGRLANWQTDWQTDRQTGRPTDKEIDGQIHYLGPPLIVGHFEEGDRREPLHITKGHTRGVEGTHNVNPPGTHQSQLSTSTPRSGMSVTFSQT